MKKADIEFKLYDRIHTWLKTNYGLPSKCDMKGCNSESTRFEWALKKKKKYDFKRENFIRMCKQCHSRYDNISQYHRGEKNNFARLTKKDVIKIRKLYKPRKFTLKMVAKLYNVNFTTIYLIITRKNWKHVK